MSAPPIDIMIAGAQKCGTSSIAALLARHDDVVLHESFEFPYFTNDSIFATGYEQAYAHHYVDGGTGRVGAKSAGLMYLPQGRERLAAHNPRCRIVVILRDPVRRAWSAYWFLRRTGHEDAPTFEAALAAEQARLADDPDANHLFAYRDRGDYLPQIEALESLFELPVTVLVLEELHSQPDRSTATLLEALDLAPEHLRDAPVGRSNAAAAARNVRIARALRQPSSTTRRIAGLLPPGLRNGVKRRLIKANERPFEPGQMEACTRAELEAWFAPRNERLAAHLGRDLSMWST